MMKKFYMSFTLCLLAGMLASAAPRYWVGPLNGNWNNPTNWAATSGGAGGAGVPGTADSVIFDVNVNALVNVNVSPRIRSLSIISASVTLYTSVPTVFTITGRFFIGSFFLLIKGGLLKDSTSADVRFDFVFEGATGSIVGDWVFEGGVPVSRGNGPTFTAPPGSRLVVTSANSRGSLPGRIISKRNTPDISSSATTLVFNFNSNFILDNNPTGAIPAATWAGEVENGGLIFLASTVFINGDLTGELRHLANRPSYGSFRADLRGLTKDASLALPHGTLIRGDLSVTNTNNHTLTLLAGTGPLDSVVVAVGIERISELLPRGNIIISGDSTRVTLALATSAAPGTIYRLQSTEAFTQSGGHFSLQDYDNPTGSTTLSTKGSLFQTGGTFFTNSTATGPDARFIVELDDPQIFFDRNIFRTLKFISMSGGTIDNGRSVVTLRINHRVVRQPIDTVTLVENGVTLLTPLKVGRLDLFRGPLTTSATNMLTVTDPNAATAVTVSSGFVNGPLRRRTNSSDPYVFPTGKGNAPPARIIADSCVIVPATNEPSEYQAEYFFTRYADTQNVRPPLKGVSIDEYWNIARISGADATVRLIVNRSIPRATNRDVLVVARYTGSEWVSEQGSILSPGDTTAGSVVSRNLSEFGPFTFGYYPAAVISPVFVKCPSNIIVNTDQNSCNALVDFKAESVANSAIVYRIGSTIITSPYTFLKGTTTVEAIASDNISTASCSFTVKVNDVQAPVITGISANPAILSPADNALKNVFIDYKVTDNCGTVTTTLSVTSNQPPTGNDVDWEIVDGHNVRLRAGQSGEDRVYTITITSTDESGNQAVKTVTVTVPKTTVTEKIKLDLKVMPNPSKTYFTLYVRSNSDKPATLQVFDLFGRVKEVRSFYPTATIRLGDNYRPGVYFVKITQGNAEVYTALIKLPG